MYCSHLWSSFKKCTLNKLRVAYNNCLRRLMSIPKFCSASQMFVYLDVWSFGEIRRKMVFNFIDRLKKSDNGLITSPPIGGGRGIVMPMSVCLCVCLSVFSQNFKVYYLSHFSTDHHET